MLRTSNHTCAALVFAIALSTSGCAQTSPSPTPPPPAAKHSLHAQSPTRPSKNKIQILTLNAKNNHPITDEKLNVAIKKDQIGSVAMPTDKEGIIEVETGDATILRILSNMYADCRPRGELYTNYSIAQIRSEGITAGNLCSDAKPKAKPGELILFEVPRTHIPKYPEPPASKASTVPVTPAPPPISAAPAPAPASKEKH